jgi:hypothetical protein
VAAAVIPDALRDLQLHGIDHHMLLPDMYGAATHANALLEFPACETGRARRARPLLQRSHP